MKLQNGQLVIYKPTHAENFYHNDCEVGVVFEVNESTAFVRYFRNGMLQHTAESTNLSDLKIVSFKGKFNYHLNDIILTNIDYK